VLVGKKSVGGVYYVLVSILGIAGGASLGGVGFGMLVHLFWQGRSVQSYYRTIDNQPSSVIGAVIGGIVGLVVGIAWLKAKERGVG
jgi:hypothetical protein